MKVAPRQLNSTAVTSRQGAASTKHSGGCKNPLPYVNLGLSKRLHAPLSQGFFMAGIACFFYSLAAAMHRRAESRHGGMTR